MIMPAIKEKLKDEIKDGWQVSEAAVQLFRGAMPNILALVNEKFRLNTPNDDSRSIPQNLDFLMDAHRHFGEMLLAVYQFQHLTFRLYLHPHLQTPIQTICRCGHLWWLSHIELEETHPGSTCLAVQPLSEPIGADIFV